MIPAPLRETEAPHLRAKVPEFRIGDTVDVHVRIEEVRAKADDKKKKKEEKEGEKRTRIQVFSGDVIARKHGGVRETFTVRRIVQGEGVERIFPIHSPLIEKVEVRKHGRVRRAKLYYLRNLTGRSGRLRERQGSRGEEATRGTPAPAAVPDAPAAAEAPKTAAREPAAKPVAR